LGIAMIYLHVGGVPYIVGKLLKRPTTLLQTPTKFKKKNNIRINIVGGNKVVYYGKAGCGIPNKASQTHWLTHPQTL